MGLALSLGIDLGTWERRNYSSLYRVEDTGWIANSAHIGHIGHIGRMASVRLWDP